jgi:hypothetical protein
MTDDKQAAIIYLAEAQEAENVEWLKFSTGNFELLDAVGKKAVRDLFAFAFRHGWTLGVKKAFEIGVWPWVPGPPPNRDDGHCVLVRLKPGSLHGTDLNGNEYHGQPIVVCCWGDKLKTTFGQDRLSYEDVAEWMEQ